MSLFSVILRRRLFILLAAAVLAGCSSESWDWNWGRQGKTDTPANKPVTKAKPPAEQPKTAKTDAKPGPKTPDDAQANQVNTQIEQYTDRMKASDQTGYAPNDLNSKIQRQQDPNRRNRIRKVAEEGRTEPPATVKEQPTRTASDSASTAVPTGREAATTPRGTESPDEPKAKPGEPRTIAADSAKPATEPKTGQGNIGEATPSALTGTDSSIPAKPIEKRATEGAAAERPPVLEDIKISPAPESATPTKTTEDAKDDTTKTPPRGRERDEETDPQPTVEPKPGKDAGRSEIKDDKPAITPGEGKATKPRKSDSSGPSRMAPNVPTPNPQAVDTFKQRLEDLEAKVKKEPSNLEDQFRLRMMYLLNGQDEQAAAPIDGADADMQEVILAHFKALITAKSAPGRDPALSANQQLEQIEALRNIIRARADLRVPKVVLCTAIESFGRYTPIEPAEFKAGDKNRVLLYIEVDNFKSETTPSGLYRTLLNLRVSVLSTSGQEVGPTLTDSNIEDLARQQRRDFYLTIGELTIDRKLAPGDYVLKVEVEDVLAGKINNGVAKFKIVP
jgi:hypothetical protein